MNKHENEATRHQLHVALAHPLRRTILMELAGAAELSPQECARRVRAQLGVVSYHFRKLAETETITLVRTEPVRGSLKHYYRFAIEESWALEALGLPAHPGA